MSSASEPISKANATSEIRSPATGPTIAPPKTFLVSGSNKILVLPWDAFKIMAFPLADQGKSPSSYGISLSLASFSVSPTQAISGSV